MIEKDTAAARSSFERAATFLKAGDSTTAERICRNALGRHPRDANLLCLLGASLIKLERASEAEEHLRLATALAPGYAGAHEGLAEALIMQGRLQESLASLQAAQTLEPARASVQLKLGRVLAALGRGKEADRAFEASFAATPQRSQLVAGLEAQRRGDLAGAEKRYRDVLVDHPDDVDALRLLAGLAMRAEQWGDAEVLLRRALELAPDFFQGWMDLGLAQQEQDKLDEAEQSFGRALRLEPARPQPHVAQGTVMAMAGRHMAAIAAFEQALERDARNAQALAGLGHVLKTIGEQHRAIATYRRCIAAHSDHGEAYWSLANLKTFRFDDADMEAMRGQLARARLADEPRVNFLFALATELEHRGDYAAAFDYYRQGNELRRRRESYDPVHTAQLHDRIIEVFDAELLAARRGCGHPSDAPIFIVGLPRSGSTLIEQILASHSLVEGTHELPDLSQTARSTAEHRRDQHSYPETVPHLGPADLHALGARYLERTQRHRSGAPRFTDKMPNNFAHVGLLALILPNARIINARRHPLDSCLGSYKQLFARGQPFTYDLFELGEYYLEYERLMAHWHALLPGRVLDVQYEALVTDFEPQLRRILDYCGLAYEPACLAFHENPRAVKTASSEQVRQPVHAGALHRWRHYEAQLAPLIEVLTPLLRTLPAQWQPQSLRAGAPTSG